MTNLGIYMYKVTVQAARRSFHLPEAAAASVNLLYATCFFLGYVAFTQLGVDEQMENIWQT